MFKKIKFALLFVLAVFFLSACKTNNVISFNAMDTFMSIKSYGKKSATANQKAKQRILELESYFSTTNPESDLFIINNSTHQAENTFHVHPETCYLVDYALKMAEKTDGSYTPTLFPITKAWGFTTNQYQTPSAKTIQELLPYTDYRNVSVDLINNTITTRPNVMLDLGSVAKGYSGDQIVQILKSYKLESALLDLGGNIQVFGKKADGSLWRIGLKNPWGGPVMAVFTLTDSAIITSGGSERFFTDKEGQTYIHIFDGKTGYPVNNQIVQSTIICSSGTYGDTLSTTTFILGKEKAIELWKTNKDFEMVLLLEDHSICYTNGLKGSIELVQDFSNIEIVE